MCAERKGLDPESCAVGPSLPAKSARRPGMLHVHPTARDPAMGTLRCEVSTCRIRGKLEATPRKNPGSDQPQQSVSSL